MINYKKKLITNIFTIKYLFFSYFIHNWLLNIIIAFITGACGVLAFSPYNFWPASIFSITGLLLIILNNNNYRSIFLGLIWGIGLFGTGINWIYISISNFGNLSTFTNIILIVILIFYLALYPMLFTTLFVNLCSHLNLYIKLILGAPVLWLITEYLRNWVITGFPWLEFGYSQIDGPLKGIAPILGVKAITFVLVIISGLITISLIQCRLLPIIWALVIILLLWPLNSLKWYKLKTKKNISIALVQGNIKQSTKWHPEKINSIKKIYLQLTVPFLKKAKIIIWPETAIPDIENNQINFLKKINRKLKPGNTYLITGILTKQTTSTKNKYYNSIIVLDGLNTYNYNSKNKYNKHHLVPFGEIIPFKKLLQLIIPSLFVWSNPFLSKGEYLQKQLIISGIKFVTTICYEIIFENQVRDNFSQDTDLILNISNDAWFENSIGPWQHFQIARMRSLELGRPLIRSTNNGITAVINADGTIKTKLLQFTRDTLITKVTPTNGTTPYSYMGYWPLFIYILTTGIIILILKNKK